MKPLEEKITEIRKTKNISKIAMTGMMSMSKSTYARFEKGGFKTKIGDLERFGKLVDKTVLEIFNWGEKGNYPKNNVELARVEENYTNCKGCNEKDERIAELKENLNDLRKAINRFEDDTGKEIRDVS